MSKTVSFKVPREIKERMAKLSSEVRWAEELRNYVAQRIKRLERKQTIAETETLLGNIRPAPKGTSTSLLREDRESH